MDIPPHETPFLNHSKRFLVKLCSNIKLLSPFSLCNSEAVVGLGERDARNLCPPLNALERFLDGVGVVDVIPAGFLRYLGIFSLCGAFFLDGGGDHIVLWALA